MTEQPLENTFTPNPSPEDEFSELIFTRYLYPKEQVCHSLLLALLEHNVREALFWGYELYYSGFTYESVQYIANVHEKLYLSSNTTKFNNYILRLFTEYENDNDKHWILGVMIWNMAIRPYNLSVFMEQYFSIKCDNPLPSQPTPGKYLITMIDTKPYENMIHVPQQSRFMLQKCCKYKLRNEVKELFKTTPFQVQSQYLSNWLYYAYSSPIWEFRVQQFKGSQNHEEKTIEFENEDLEEEFHNLYNYETDEQPLSIQAINIGNYNDVQLSIKDFCKKYGANMNVKKVKSKKPIAHYT